MTWLMIMLYREKLSHKYSQQFQTLFRKWDMDEQRTKEEGEKVTVGIRFCFIMTLL